MSCAVCWHAHVVFLSAFLLLPSHARLQHTHTHNILTLHARRGIVAGAFFAGIAAMFSYMRFQGKYNAPVSIGSSEDSFAARHPVAPMHSLEAMPAANSANPLHANASALSDPRAVL